MQTAATDTIHIQKQINTPVERVWRAWTDPATVLQWFGSDPAGWGVKADMEVRPGGRFEVTFCNSDGEEQTCFGIYEEVQPFNKLAFTWEWKSELGVVSFVTLELAPLGGATQMKFTHANVGYASAHNYLKGWQDTFEKLERVLG